MTKEMIIENMVEHIKQIEKENSNQKFSENISKKNVVNSILEELERLTKDEN